uniref:SET domain-containing protein n=1 Tax=Tetradesmus obliquus TaxID=3088 RepID=A0A383VU49_TETOB|eukprot:jgi/Sobl393_1/5125/SZX68413.1
MARRQLRSTNCANRSLGHVHIKQPHFSIAAAAARQQQHRPAVLSQAVNGQIDINEIYTSSDSISNPYVGPVKAVRLKVGLGLESSRSLQAGETLLLSTPLALISHSAEELAGASPPTAGAAAASSQGVIPGEDDAGDDAEDDGAADDESGYDEGGQQYEATDTDIDQLAEQLAGSSSARTRAWLQFLDDGSLEPSRTSQLPDLLALAALSSSSSSSEEASPAAAAAAAPDSSSSSRQIDDNTLLDITDLNVQVLVEDDALLGLNAAAAAAAAGGSSVDDGLAAGFEEPKTLVGIWPELNLLQHSCSPNTSVVAHKSAAIVTASRGVAKQAALSRNLLGANLLAPLGERRAALQEMTGSKCMCLRCRDEERTDRNFQQLMAEIHEACIQQVGPDLEQAVEVDDEAAMEGLRDQLAAYCEVVDAAFSKFAVKQQTQIWLQASLFKLYELTAIASAACGAVDARLLELLAALAGEVCPGSSEHIFWARQYRNEIASDEEAYFDGALRQAEKTLLGAYQARYGKGLSRGLYKQLDAQAQQPELELEFEYE